MKDYRDLTISGTRDQLVATAAEIEKILNDGWKRKNQIEEDTRPRSGLAPDQMIFCFACTATPSRKGALLVLMSNREDNPRLTNIVPDEMGRLSYDEFNYILEEFLKKFARPAADRMGATVETSSGVVTIEDWFHPETAEKLRRFLIRSHGNTNRTEDYRLWMAFLVSAHRENAKVHGDLLRRWLKEDAGLYEDVADQLASEYQSSQEILEYAGA
jgi:hypothetical protein